MPYQNLHLKVTVQTTSAVVDPPSFGLNYQATGGTPTLADVQALDAYVANSFQDLTILAGGGISQLWGRCVSRSSTSGFVQAYDITGHEGGTPYGSPVDGVTFHPSVQLSSSPLPEGVAICITLQAPYGTDVEFAPGARPRARDRGRIYFGPLDASVMQTDPTDQRVTLVNTYKTALLNWIKKIAKVAGVSAIQWLLSVWSRKSALLKPLTEAWIDDRPDYQRRRVDQGIVKQFISLP